MIRIANNQYAGNLNVRGNEVEAVISGELTNEELTALKDATLVELVNGDVVSGTYNLVNWRRIETSEGNTHFVWQTYSTNEVDTLRSQVGTLQTKLAQSETTLSETAARLTQSEAALSETTARLTEATQNVEDLTEALLELAELLCAIEPVDDYPPEDDPETEGGEVTE